MGDTTFEALRKRVSDDLNGHLKEFGKTVEEIDRNFRYLGLGMAVWHPERIHVTNIGGLDAESYVGYSRIEGRWGLIIRTIERDIKSQAFVSQRVYTIESCGNMEIVVNALKKVPELMQHLDKVVAHQLKTLGQAGKQFEALRDPDHCF